MILLGWMACAGEKVDSSNADSEAPASWSVSAPARVFTGGYADASVLDWNDRTWMYLNSVAEEPGGTLLFVSQDAESWVQETPVLFAGVATGRAVVMDGGVRFVYPARGPAAEQSQPVDGETSLYSAFSTDGVAFVDDDGARLVTDSGEPGGPSMLQLSDGTWRLWFHLSTPSADDPAVDSAAIWGATSEDGLSWILDENPTFEAQAEVEGVEPAAQVLHPFVFTDGDGLYWMIYNAHAKLYVARSLDAVAWEKQGALGVDGSDATVLGRDDGRFTMWFGTYSDETAGEIWSATLHRAR